MVEGTVAEAGEPGTAAVPSVRSFLDDGFCVIDDAIDPAKIEGYR
jgi:hypothetical protein